MEMIRLVIADLYKELRKKSFKFFVALIIFVSILSLVVIYKNDNFVKEIAQINPLFSESEYLNVNKYGDYQQYLSNYSDYEKVVNIQNNIILSEDENISRYLLGYSHTFLFILGIAIVYVAYNSFSYDYQTSSIKYLFISSDSRKKIYFSKIISVLTLCFILFLILIFSMLITAFLLTHDNILSMKSLVLVKNELKEVAFIFEFLKNAFLFFVPFIFMIVFSMFLCILFKGNNLGLILSFIFYVASLLLTQIFLNYGLSFVKYSFLPFIDFTYYSNPVNVIFNNIIYNLDFSTSKAIIMLCIYSILFVLISLKLIKRDV